MGAENSLRIWAHGAEKISTEHGVREHRETSLEHGAENIALEHWVKGQRTLAHNLELTGAQKICIQGT